ncbi:MAG: hypothetical protein LBJ96_01955 [Holosporaceae bacterium]|jgi:hypothetical protein|nr:hypothetical protein [Holosporaceae bacterium]
MKKLQLAAILSAALLGIDCNGMTPEAERIVREKYGWTGIPVGTPCPLNLTKVLTAARGKSTTFANSSRAVGLAVNRLADALSVKEVKEDSPELLAAQINLANVHRSYINQMLRLQRPAVRYIHYQHQPRVALAPVLAPSAQRRQVDERRQKLIEEQNLRNNLIIRNLQPLHLEQTSCLQM